MPRHKDTSRQPDERHGDFPQRFIGYCQQVNSERDCEREETSPANKNQNYWEKFNAIGVTAATVVIAVTGIAAAVVSYFQWAALHSTDDAIRGQLTIMEADQRPWVK